MPTYYIRGSSKPPTHCSRAHLLEHGGGGRGARHPVVVAEGQSSCHGAKHEGRVDLEVGGGRAGRVEEGGAGPEGENGGG